MYARFNKTLRLLTYTDDEYERYFQGPAQPNRMHHPCARFPSPIRGPRSRAPFTRPVQAPRSLAPFTRACHSRARHADSKWTREETDRLFALCKQFDLRFPVIADRIEPPRSIEVRARSFVNGAPRKMHSPKPGFRFAHTSSAVQDAKARYFGISRKLIELRNDPSDPAIQAEMAKYNYDHGTAPFRPQPPFSWPHVHAVCPGAKNDHQRARWSARPSSTCCTAAHRHKSAYVARARTHARTLARKHA